MTDFNRQWPLISFHLLLPNEEFFSSNLADLVWLKLIGVDEALEEEEQEGRISGEEWIKVAITRISKLARPY